MKTKVKSYGDEVTDFLGKNIPKVDSNHNYLAVLSLDSGLKKDENYYLQVFLKEWKYSKKLIRHINNSTSDFFSSDDSDDSDEV